MTLNVNQVVIHWFQYNLAVNTKTEEKKVFPQTNCIVSFHHDWGSGMYPLILNFWGSTTIFGDKVTQKWVGFFQGNWIKKKWNINHHESFFWFISFSTFFSKIRLPWDYTYRVIQKTSDTC